MGCTVVNLNGFSVADIASQSVIVEARKNAPIKVARLEMLILAPWKIIFTEQAICADLHIAINHAASR